MIKLHNLTTGASLSSNEADELDEFAPYSVRIATLLGSNAPLRALVAELGRIREHELRAPADPERDSALAERVYAWFEASTLPR